MRYVISNLFAYMVGLIVLVGCSADMKFDDGSRPVDPLANPTCSGVASVPPKLYCDYVALLSADPKASGDGTASNPYEICTPQQLNAVGSDPTMFDKHIKITADIDMKCIGANHTIIGSSTNPFTGVFHGNGKKIRGFTHVDVTKDRVALFGLVKGGSIRDLTVENSTVTGNDYVGLVVGEGVAGHLLRLTAAGTVTGRVYVGGIAGRAELGAVEQSSSSAEVSGTNDVGGVVGNGGTPLVVSSFFTGRLMAAGTNSGGVIGAAAFGYVINSYSTGTITSTGPNVGGVIGSGGAVIKNIYSTGAVSGKTAVGGLIGTSNGSMSNSFSTASVKGVAGSLTNVGVLRGSTGGTNTNSHYWSGATCDADETTAGTQACGTNAATPQVSINTFYSATSQPLASWDFQAETANGVSDEWAESTNDFPTAWYVNPSSVGIPFFDGNGTIDDPYRISTTTQYNLIGSNPRWMDKHFKLTANLDFNAVTPKQIGSMHSPFYGTFDGDSKEIQNFVLLNPVQHHQGMFGIILKPGGVRDLTVSNAAVIGTTFTGILASETTGNIDRVVVAGSLTGGYHSGGMIGTARAPAVITDCSASVLFTAGSAAGGLVGNSSATITRSVAAATITNGASHMGGLVGYMDSGIILDSIASGSIGSGASNRTGGLVGHMIGTARVERSYSTATVRGLSYSGGLAGFVDVGATIEDSFATGNVSGNGGATLVGPLIGQSTGTVTNAWITGTATCDSSTAGGVQACNTSYYAGTAASVNTFYDPTNSPLSSWDFITTWQSDLLSLPVLR